MATQYSASMFSQFERLGYPGKFVNPLLINSSTTVDLTGSNYGYGAFMIANATNVQLTASNGTPFVNSEFNLKEIYEIGLQRVKIGATGKVYVFKRQQ